MSRTRLSFELLEARTLLSDLTVITHGNTGVSSLNSAFPAWVSDMALAINARMPDPCDTTSDGDRNGVPDTIQNARVGLAGAPPAGGCDHFLLFDWSAQSTLDNPGAANEESVAGVLAAAIRDRLARLPQNERLDLHFIGFSRGAYVNNDVIRRLGDDPRIGWLQMTTLDAQAVGTEGTLAVLPQVDWADNYYQRDPLDAVNGAVLPGAVNVAVTDAVRAWPGRSNLSPSPSHSEVHDWYHWTIDTDDRLVPQIAYLDPDLVAQQAQFVREASAVLTTTRTRLYVGLGVDLNGLPGPDWLAWGEKTGYYLSLRGGGVGTVLLDRKDQVFTLDLRDGSTPIYLGSISQPMWNIALDPSGRLFTANRFGLYRITVRFDDQNHPTLTTDLLEGLGGGFWMHGLAFRADGVLFASLGQWIYRVYPETGAVEGVFTLPLPDDYSGDISFDAAGALYSARWSDTFMKIDAAFTRWTEVAMTRTGVFFGLLTGPDGALYRFWNEATHKQIYRITPTTGAVAFVADIVNNRVADVNAVATLLRTPRFPTSRSSINGQVFHDRNGNGVRELNEKGLAGWVVFADTNGDGILNNPVGGPNRYGVGATEPCSVTAGDGTFILGNLLLGTYPIRVVRLAAWMQTTVRATDVVLMENETVIGFDLGYALPVRITGRVFLDTNRNGRMDQGESGLRGWTIFLDANGNGKRDAHEPMYVTGSGGRYQFSGLRPGTKTLMVLAKRGYRSRRILVFVASDSTRSVNVPIVW